MKLNYLCDFRSLISEIWSWGSPLNPLSNAIGLTWFGFFKENLCPISHNDLIMDWFSRENLYDLPCVIIFSFGSKIYRKETTVHVLPTTFYRIPIWFSERESYEDFPTITSLDEIQEPEKDLTYIDHIFENVANQVLKFFDAIPQDFDFTL